MSAWKSNRIGGAHGAGVKLKAAARDQMADSRPFNLLPYGSLNIVRVTYSGDVTPEVLAQIIEAVVDQEPPGDQDEYEESDFS